VLSRTFSIGLVRIGLLFLRRAAKNKHVFEYCAHLPKSLSDLNRLGEPSALKALQHAFALRFAVGSTIGFDGRDS
jgi:hypothetical protein